ncbi:MAG: hypothetical protein AAFR74_08415, partial [Pseudomonadota bacterium]
KAARRRFGERLALSPKWPPITRQTGDMARLEKLRNKHAYESLLVLGNGPSLQGFDPALLERFASIGSNGVYRAFPEWERATDYMIIEDVEQAEKRGKVFRQTDGPVKLAALYTAHAIPRPWPEDLLFYNARYTPNGGYWDDWGPLFSRDFSGCVWLGNTVTYIGLQLAWHLGAQTVYLAGVDFTYGPLEKKYGVGKLRVTDQNLADVQQCHFDPDYHKIGDVIGVPDTAKQYRAYQEAQRIFEAAGKRIINLTPNSKLDVFERADMASVLGS